MTHERSRQPGSLSIQSRATLLNSLSAVAEYASQPLGLLLAAPYLLRHMGASQFGIWVLASAAVNSGNTLSSGFGDAAIKYVAMYRGRDDSDGIARIVRGMLSINLALSSLFAIAFWSLAPYTANHIAPANPELQDVCIKSFRLGSLLLAVRSLDGVFASTLRAFERYSPAVRITMCSRIASLLAAVALVARGLGVVEIMMATLSIATVAALAQGIAVRSIVGKITLLPSLHRDTLSLIAGFGCFSWLQTLSAVIFGQADRLVIGLFLGAPAVAVYALCAQAAQTIHGIAGAGLHVLFPHLSSRLEAEPLADLRRTVWTALKANAFLAIALGAPMVLFSYPILSLWMGPEFAHQAWPILSILAAGYVLFSMNVTAHYALLALGRVRLITYLNLAAGAATLLVMLLLTPRFGVVGTACARFITGPVTCILYLPLYRRMSGNSTERSEPSTLVVLENI
jgi:O-antigen/teichoic acid export membrane protein